MLHLDYIKKDTLDRSVEGLLVIYVLSSGSPSAISNVGSDKLLVLEPTTRSISDHTSGKQPTMQPMINAWQRTNLRGKQYEDFLPCFAHTNSLSPHTQLLQLISRLATPPMLL